MRVSDSGNEVYMTALLVILVVLALLFGVGSVLEGLAWGFILVVALLAAAAWLGWRKLHEAAG